MSLASVIAVLTLPVLGAIGIGSLLLKRALARPRVLLEEYALAVAWVFVVGGMVWLGVFLSGGTLLGFGAPWTGLAAAHFVFAGGGALTVTALCCRAVSRPGALRLLRGLLVVHPAAYLVTAAGISGYPYCDEIGAVTYECLFVAQLGAFLVGRPELAVPVARRLVVVALVVPVVTLVPGIAWAWGKPLLDLGDMVRYHGLVNAIGHVGLGVLAFVWGRPQAHSAE